MENEIKEIRQRANERVSRIDLASNRTTMFELMRFEEQLITNGLLELILEKIK